MAITMDGIFVNGQKVTFAPENILTGDASAYTQEIGTAVEAWMEENVTGGEQVTDTTLTLPGVPADAKKTGDEIGALKEVLNIEETYSLTWEQGGLNNSGNKSSSNNDIRVRSASYVGIINDSIAIIVPQGYKLLIHVYDRTNGTSHLGYLPSVDDITDNAEFTISAYYPNATHLKFVLGKVDNSNVSPTIAELYKFTTKLNNIARLTDAINNTNSNVARNAANIPVSAFLSAIDRMCVCGASWDSGYVYTEQGSTVEHSYIAWGYQLSKKYNFTFVCSARHSLYTKTWLTSPYGIAYVNKHDPCDLYVLTFGGNDSKQGTEYLGALEDITSHESYDDYADSFYGNYGRIIEQIQEHAPNALIVCGMYNDGTTARNQYYTALQNICEHYHIPIFNWYEDEWYRTYLQDNLIGSHPTATLHSGIALAFERIYNNLVVDNYDYFKFLRTKGDGADEQVTDTTLSLPGVPADAEVTGKLREEFIQTIGIKPIYAVKDATKLPRGGEFIRFNVHVSNTWSHGTYTDTNDHESGEEHDHLCILTLPESYTASGKRTPLIMYCHGASCGITETKWYGNSTGEGDGADFLALIRRFTATGYAVFDVDNTRHVSSGFNDWGSLPLMSAYIKAWEYIKENYNVSDKLFILSASMGTPAALNMMKWHKSDVLASLILAPRPFGAKGRWNETYDPITDARKKEFLVAWGFEPDSILEDETFVVPSRDSVFTADIDSKLRGFYHYENIVTIGGTDYVFEKYPPMKVMVGLGDTDFLSEVRRFFSALSNFDNYINYRELAGQTHGQTCTLNNGNLRDEALAWFERFRYAEPDEDEET